MVIACPSCASRLNVPDDAPSKPDRKVLCPGCKQVFVMKAGIRAARSSPPSQPPAPTASPSKAPEAAQPEAATRRMTRVDLSSFQASLPGTPPARAATTRADDPSTSPMPGLSRSDELSLDPALAEPPGLEASVSEAWEVDRKDYKGTIFDMQELRDLVKRGWLDPADPIRVPGSASWIDAGFHPQLASAFAIRKKSDQAKLAAPTTKPLGCANHPQKRATHRCDQCAHAYCGACGNESELRQLPVLLCLQCDIAMTPLR